MPDTSAARASSTSRHASADTFAQGLKANMRNKLAPYQTLRQASHEILVSRVSPDHVSARALDRLGVNPDILKKEKGMKKLGISDFHIECSEQLQRYSGITLAKAKSLMDVHELKTEAILGATEEQRKRDRGIKRLGTSEEEVSEAYSRRLSLLGTEMQIPEDN
ncbi:TPA: hypothetical protein N0F65_008751 [Lagenidium giganteum]|uniref:Uncharacterized protein n=1 Tax=Lagenidium giganteum TaxID=4803 RepID=A0AAV2Z5F9_9STRA|nr:TPA: hypothetical protein N0F65_008751 [Lagenidium giganteum]